MQNVPSLVDAPDTEADSTPAPVGRAWLGWRPLALRLWMSIGSASLAGLIFGVSDLFRACSAVGIERVSFSAAVAMVGLWLWFGQMLGLALGVARLLGAAIKAQVRSQKARHALLALAVGGVTLLLAHKVFSGDGIRHTHWGSWGPWLVPLFSTLGVWGTAQLMTRHSLRLPRWLSVGGMAGLSIAAVVLDARAPGGYLYLHILLLSTGLALAALATQQLRLPARARAAACAASLLTLPSLLSFPSSLTARELLARPQWAGVELIDYAQYHVDFDHDGHSPIFGGDDCDDADATTFVGAPERPRDGRDSDCDGLDSPIPATLVFEPFHTKGTQRALQLAERAKQFPTVVILVDALRFDRIGSARFPNLSQLARESIRFTRMYATSSTTMTSVPALMSGQVRPAPERETIARALTRVGQSSTFVGPDVLISHFAELGARDPLRAFTSREIIPTDYRTNPRGNTVPTSDRTTATAVAQLDSAQPPNLLWLHYYDVHQWNVLAEDELPPQGNFARYDAVLERLDASLRPLMDRRDSLTLVLLADHGEALGTRGIRTHTNFVFEEVTHIPMLVRVPGSEPATVDVPTTHTGMFNMVRTLRGLDSDESVDANLLSLVGASNVGDGPGFPGFDGLQWSFLYGKHRLLYMPHQQLLELYDLERDPLEQRNQSEQNPKLAAELLARLIKVHNEPAR